MDIHTQRAEALKLMAVAFSALANGFKKLGETYDNDGCGAEADAFEASCEHSKNTAKEKLAVIVSEVSTAIINAEPTKITRADIDGICNRLREKKLTAKIKELLAELGYAKLSEVPEATYDEFYAKLTGIENGK